MSAMSANGLGAGPGYPPSEVLNAVATMRSNNQEAKKKAHEYLEGFQKSTTAWTTTITILQSEAEADAKLFAATTLRGKITYDLSTQVASSEHVAVRTQLLELLKIYAPGPKPIRVQLCVCLAILAIQMLEWKDVLPLVISSLGDQSHVCILDFLRILPEEVTEGRKITLSEDELHQRTTELLTDNAPQVLNLLINYAHSSAAAATNPQLLECITSWMREVAVRDIVQSPLLDVVFNALNKDESFKEASECVSNMVRDTRDVDENVETIQLLLPRIIALQPRIQALVEEEDVDSFKSLTRLFSEAGIAWVVAIAREPATFRPLVEAILECAARDQDRDAIEYTFEFWYELKQYLELEKYIQARMELLDVYSRLVDILLKHLQYPQPESGSEDDLFQGDREQEEKFREFRHKMGDALKDSCAVMGVTECLNKVLDAINLWMQTYASQVQGTFVPHWQGLEAAVFSLRAMGRVVDKEENIVLPQLMPLLVQMPAHEKLRFATIMVLGRYTEWTAAHPEFIQDQFTYIVASFQTESEEVVRAAAMAVKYFCSDCKYLLSGQVLQLQQFYDEILDKLPYTSQQEMTEGVASVVAVQPRSEIYQLLKVYCDPVVNRLMKKANEATDDPSKLAVADCVELLTIYQQIVVTVPPTEHGEEDPAMKYWQEIFPIQAKILENFVENVPICHQICRSWRSLIISHRQATKALLPEIADQLARGFEVSKRGYFLWVTGSILREFSEDRDFVDQSTAEYVFAFFETQATNVLRFFSLLPPREMADVVTDFFYLADEAMIYYPHKLVISPLFTPIFELSLSVLSMEQRDTLSTILIYIRNLLRWGNEANPPVSAAYYPPDVVAHLRVVVKQLLLSQGDALVKRILAGMMISFPRDCFVDGSGALLQLFEIIPNETIGWVDETLRLLPQGTVTAAEADRLVAKIRERLGTNSKEGIQIRSILQDFTNTYRRRFVAPRDGLERLQAARFSFSG